MVACAQQSWADMPICNIPIVMLMIHASMRTTVSLIRPARYSHKCQHDWLVLVFISACPTQILKLHAVQPTATRRRLKYTLPTANMSPLMSAS